MITRIADPLAAPNTGSYSPAIRAGDWVIVSGQGPIDTQGRIVPGSIESEVRLTLENVRRLLEAAGARMDQVVKCTCYLADIADFPAFDAAYRAAFGTTLPARTTVEAGLAGIKVEIDAMAHVGS
ncbi:MAG TPA: RidA family protein [Devosia sp.]|nr:RidA family protein [Devosia sp.]